MIINDLSSVAIDIAEMFDLYLCSKEVAVPCENRYEESDRPYPYGLYGSEYANMIYQIENLLKKTVTPIRKA